MASPNRSDVTDNMAAAGEQFRKAAEATTEQARRTVSSLQDQLQQNVNRAQQMQSDVARMMIRVNEQNSQAFVSACNSFWDASLWMLKFATFGQEQSEKAVQQAMASGKEARQEAAVLVRDAADQVRARQTELVGLAQESLRVGLFYAGKSVRAESDAAR